jgi:hypothetical protein
MTKGSVRRKDCSGMQCKQRRQDRKLLLENRRKNAVDQFFNRDNWTEKTKEELRKIKNRESAMKSRKRIRDNIESLLFENNILRTKLRSILTLEDYNNTIIDINDMTSKNLQQRDEPAEVHD